MQDFPSPKKVLTQTEVIHLSYHFDPLEVRFFCILEKEKGALNYNI